MDNPSYSPVVKIVTQRGKGDCGICALAMFLDKSYEDVLSAAVKHTHSRRLHHSGMYWREIRDTAGMFGVRLRTKRKWDTENDCGILSISLPERQHVTLLKQGLIFDTDGYVWEPDAFYLAFEGRPTALYVVDDREEV